MDIMVSYIQHQIMVYVEHVNLDVYYVMDLHLITVKNVQLLMESIILNQFLLINVNYNVFLANIMIY
jgi:hypothetical protein